MESQKRYNKSDKGKNAAKRYEQSGGGKEARERYLKSDKYKQRRREYNQRLKESLQIARAVLSEKATREKDEERQRTDELASLIQDIREYLDSLARVPRVSEVITWARDAYNVNITTAQANTLIDKAKRRR